MDLCKNLQPQLWETNAGQILWEMGDGPGWAVFFQKYQIHNVIHGPVAFLYTANQQVEIKNVFLL